jgi:hypothetical protein
MKKITAYSIRVWDGGDRCNHKFYVASEEEAKKWIKANTYDNYYEVDIEIYDTLEDWAEHNEEAIRKRALRKLSPEERAALGWSQFKED